MRRVALLFVAACKPDLGAPASLVTEPRVLAVQSEPAEVAPNHDTTLTALIVTPDGTVMPDVTIVLDVPTKVSLSRLKQRASDLPDRMERENVDFYEKVRTGYLLLAKGMPERFIVIDGTKSEDVIAKQIWTEVQTRLKG